MIDELSLNFNILDSNGRVFKNIIQENFNIIESKLKELLAVEYNLPKINNANNINVNDIASVELDTLMDSVFNLGSFINIYKMSYIPYDLIRHSKFEFSFKFLDSSGTEHSIQNFKCIDSSENRYLIINSLNNTVSNMAGVTVGDYVIGFYEYDNLFEDNWTFNIDPLPFKKSMTSTLFESYNMNNTKTIAVSGSGEVPVYGRNDNAYVMLDNPNIMQITEGI